MIRLMVVLWGAHQQDGLHRADAVILRAPVCTVVVKAFLQDVLVPGEVHVGVGYPPGGGNRRLSACCSDWSRRSACKWRVVYSRPADDVDGARGGFVAEQLDVGDGLRHLKGVLVLQVLLLLRLLKHHHHGVRQLLRETEKRLTNIKQTRALLDRADL